MIYTHTYRSPAGPIYLAVNRRGAVLRLSYAPITDLPENEATEENKYACGEVEWQLDRYFAGELRQFDIAVEYEGTGFQRAVWGRLRKVEYGTTITYGLLAQKIGRRDAAQAVGNAVAANPIAIIIPCHRVIPASGNIGSYARRSLPEERGNRTKRFLLRLEGAI